MAIDWHVSRWGTLADPRPGRAEADQYKSSEFLHELRMSVFPRFWINIMSPTCFREKLLWIDSHAIAHKYFMSNPEAGYVLNSFYLLLSPSSFLKKFLRSPYVQDFCEDWWAGNMLSSDLGARRQRSSSLSSYSSVKKSHVSTWDHSKGAG